QVTGVVDCIPDGEKNGSLCRQEHLGFDRHGRKYWFLARRIFVESEDGEVWYYSTPVQLEELLETIDREVMEVALAREIGDFRDEIVRQMEITEKLTNLNKGNKKSFLDVENTALLKIQKERQEHRAREEEERKERERQEAEELVRKMHEDACDEPPPIGASLSITEGHCESELDQLNKNLETATSSISPITMETTETVSTTTMTTTASTKVTTSEETEQVSEIITTTTTTTTTTSSAIKTSSTVASSEGDDDEMDIDSDKEGEEGTTKIGKDGKKHTIVTRSKTGSLQPRTFNMDDLKRRSTAILSKNELDKLQGDRRDDRDSTDGTRITRLKAQQIATGTYMFKLGMENAFKNYTNQYSTNIAALNKIQRNEERDKKRHLSHKFSLTQASDSSGLVPFMELEHCCSTGLHQPVVFASVWHEALGHVKMQRLTAAEREERKRLDKKDKKDKEEEEERNRLTYNFVKYTLGLKHQVWKQKGEEYRIHGQWGWLWLSASRRFKIQDCHKMGLRAGPQKIMVQVKDDKTIKVLAVDPNTYKYLINKCAEDVDKENTLKNLKVFPPISKFEEIDITKALTTPGRLHYPKIAKKSRLDEFLTRRTHLKVLEERKFAQNANRVNKSAIDGENGKTTPEDQLLPSLFLGKLYVPNNGNTPAGACNKDVINSISRRVAIIRQQYAKLNRLARGLSCYSRQCNVNSVQTSSSVTGVVSSCYSPLCLQKARVRRDLLILLRKANTHSNNNTLISSTVPSIKPIATTLSSQKPVKEISNSAEGIDASVIKELQQDVNSIENSESSVSTKNVESSKTIEVEVSTSTPEEEVCVKLEEQDSSDSNNTMKPGSESNKSKALLMKRKR
ncbi:hypothetical protein L9F63_010810, partial [Diploptera punctata]